MPKITASTQDFIDIIDIKDDIVILKDGKFRMVLETSAVNFDLLSEKEQDAAIYSYANFVNSLDFPVQIIIKTRQTDISRYLDFLENQKKNQPTQALKEQLDSYLVFIKQLVVENTILSKNFYVVIPYWSLETRKTDIFNELLGSLPFLKKKTQSFSYSRSGFEDAKKIFGRRQEELAWQFRRLGIKIRKLTTNELVALFYSSFNPETQSQEAIKNDYLGFQTAFTQPATAG